MTNTGRTNGEKATIETALNESFHKAANATIRIKKRSAAHSGDSNGLNTAAEKSGMGNIPDEEFLERLGSDHVWTWRAMFRSCVQNKRPVPSYALCVAQTIRLSK